MKNRKQKLHIKLGDKVKVITGDDKGKTGTVLEVFRKKSRVVVEGVNICFKHKKPNDNKQKGEILNYELPIHSSNVQKLISTNDEANKS